jgi:hypothetical protein
MCASQCEEHPEEKDDRREKVGDTHGKNAGARGTGAYVRGVDSEEHEFAPFEHGP